MSNLAALETIGLLLRRPPQKTTELAA
jgi:hypothetical protein